MRRWLPGLSPGGKSFSIFACYFQDEFTLNLHPAFLLPLLILLAACTSTSQPTAEPPVRASAVSVTMPGFEVSADTTLAWRSDLIWVDDPEGRFERRAELLQRALKDEFARKGLRFSADPDSASYDVLAIAMLGPLSGHPEVEEVFKLYPALQKSTEDYRRGSVVVAIAPRGTSDILWRGALEMFTEPNTMQPLSVREERMRWGAQQLLASIPAAH